MLTAAAGVERNVTGRTPHRECLTRELGVSQQP